MYHLITAPALAAEPAIQTQDVVAWVAQFVVPLLFAVAAVVVMSRAHQGRTRENAVVAVNLFLGVFLLAGGFVLFAFGRSLVRLFFGTV